ncbi:MAG: hypothetical protein COT39_02370 [Parcubacteria group bacterium CG08_land_8_20_14_0_20_48_21]|nr:MAG: hypothetical protein AUK21_03265 [Parcubacteria group bacterium CG2_30_48_51]PIS32838.1 MAG: hypothetical protein COT39_02370 [Parcubacteria group bacterium CG08_land_8_20_14_0_20_48_21]PIW78944.1 MAG: hypothetical protein COZ99_03785 [Parcubacteria group bacterium CG_4_8_14_3_um_filter_48_16]PIY78165.1 MAG: hypothetical protein COY83_01245 [Parcubacteria group bacterium CG_4_10_14_0_8_um_filter_48_154]PIZ77872.1 MAG: hypothetical protein COY03_01275 [bacterium CG_4_10_14_0_2_um_filter_
MRFLVITNLYAPYSKGGAERIAQTVAEELVQQGHTVRVLTTKPAFSGKRHDTINGVVVERYFPPNFCWYGNLGKLPAFLRILWHLKDMLNPFTYIRVKRAIRYANPDAVLTHNVKGIGYTIPRAIRQTGVRHIHTVHDVQLAIPSGLRIYGSEHSWQQEIFLRTWYETLCRWLFSSPDVVLFPSQFLQTFYTERGFFAKSKKITRQNPVTLTHPDPRERTSGDTLHVVYIGQMELHKGIVWFARVFAKWCAQNSPRARLFIFGAGTEFAALKKNYARHAHVQVRGPLAHDRVLTELQKADVVVVPSLCYENTPTVIFEAHAAGVPVMASRIGGIPEIMDERAGDLFFTPQHEQEAMLALEHFLKHPQIYTGSVGAHTAKEYVRKLIPLVADSVK